MIAATHIFEDLPLRERLESSSPPNIRPLLDIPLSHVRESIGILTDEELAGMDNADLTSLIVDAQLPAEVYSYQTAIACQAAPLHEMNHQQLLKLATVARNYCQR